MMINPTAVTCLILSVLASGNFFTSVGAVKNIRGAATDNHIELRHLNSPCNCISNIDSSCHPNSECESPNKCTNPKGKNKCNASGNYDWQAQPTPLPTPEPTPTPTPTPAPFATGPQTCPEQYCPTSSPTRKLEETLPRRDVVQCDLELVTLATYIAPGTTDVLIELKGPADSADALDLVIAAPHGGGLKPAYIDNRSGSGIVTSKDSYTLEVSELLAQNLIDTYCEGVPYLIINHLHRSKLDANRELEEATIGIVNGKATATEAWNKFHTYINDAQVMVGGKFGTSTGSGVTGVNGLFFDMHGYKGNNGGSDASANIGWKDDVNIHGAPFTQWGYRLSDDPSLTSCPIDNLGGTIGSFTHARSLPNQSYECLVRGTNSMGSRVNALLSNVAGISDLCGQGTPSFEYPSPNALATDATYCHDAAAGGECHYYSGGFDVRIHERMDVNLTIPEPTLSGHHFNALQAEFPRCIRFGGDTIRSDFANVLAEATMGFLRDLYGPLS